MRRDRFYQELNSKKNIRNTLSEKFSCYCIKSLKKMNVCMGRQ